MKKPFFVINPKAYLCGDKLYNLAKKADEISLKYNITIYFTAPFTELLKIKEITKNIIVTAQHMDDIELGRGMGYISYEMLKSIGVKATILNHAEHKITYEKLLTTLDKAKKTNIRTIVCASDYNEVEKIAKLNPDVILCEPTDLIGTGITSSDEYIFTTTNIIRNINPNIYVMQAAGVVKPEDVYRIIKNGADATGCTSGIVLAKNPAKMAEEMIKSLVSGFNDRKGKNENLS